MSRENNLPKHKPSEIHVKAHHIIYILQEMGYDVGNERDAIHVIETFNLDKQRFDFPYGSFDNFKSHVLSGEFDVDVKSRIMTKERREALRKAVEEGKLWVTD